MVGPQARSTSNGRSLAMPSLPCGLTFDDAEVTESLPTSLACQCTQGAARHGRTQMAARRFERKLGRTRFDRKVSRLSPPERQEDP